MQQSKNRPAGARNTEEDRKPATEPPADDRRRMGRVVHDDRGNAVVQWEEAPPDYERPVLEIESSGVHRRLGSDQLSMEPQSCDPYASSAPLERKRPTQSTGNTTRTDLRKLSEWIKMMRELEQRKLRGEPDEEE